MLDVKALFIVLGGKNETYCMCFFFFTQEGVVLHSQHLFWFYFITAVHFAGEEVCNF